MTTAEDQLTIERPAAKVKKWRGPPKLHPPMKMKKTGARVLGSKKIEKLRSGECRFPTTPHGAAPDKHRFCAKPTTGKSPYCPDHHKLCRETSDERKGKNKVDTGRGSVRLPARFGSRY